MIELTKPPKLDKLDDDALLAYLDELTSELQATNARAERLYELRTAVYVAARQRTPPITHRRLGKHSQTSDVAVVAALRKAAAG